MEVPIFLLIVFIAVVYLLWRGRRGGSGPDAYVHNAERYEPVDNEGEIKAGLYPGPGGPIAGGGGGTAAGGG